jgi:STAS-like domain of unknown function (DUF4325)
MIIINVCKDFTDTPGARHISEGEYSGELFRQKHLEKYFGEPNSKEKIKIILDGVEGYATSFLEEAFGGLARKYGKTSVLDRLEFVSSEDRLLIDEIRSYIENSDRKGK